MPQKYWAVAVPTYLSVLFVTFVFLIYPSLGLVAAPEEEEVAHSGGKEERAEHKDIYIRPYRAYTASMAQ